MFRGAYRSWRSVVPAPGFYEWTGARAISNRISSLTPKGSRSWRLQVCGWHDPQAAEDVLSCTLFVTEPSHWMLPYHDRMPVLLQQAEIDRWLSGEMSAKELQPAADSALREWSIDRRVNRSGVGDDDPTLLELIESDLL